MSAGFFRGRLVAVTLCTAVSIICFAEAGAHAARVAVHVPIIESDGKVTEGRRSKFHDTLVNGLKDAAGADTTVITGEEVRFALGDKPNLLDCKEGPCLQKVAEAVKADRIIVARITIKSAVGGSSYKIAITVYDQNGIATPTSGSESCGDDSEGCNLNRAFAALKRSTASLAGQVSGPAKPELPTTVASTDAITQPAAISAPELKEPTPVVAKPYNKGYRVGWIVAAAATGAFVVASIPFFAFVAKENQTTCGIDVPRDRCPTVYTGNLGPGLGLLVGGGLTSATAFGVLFYLDRREQRRALGK